MPHLPPQGEGVDTVCRQPAGGVGFLRADTFSHKVSFYFVHKTLGGAFIIAHTAHQINEEIRDKEVRLISATGEQLGILPIDEAMAKAAEADLDLVKISPNAVPPVCKLMDYGKYRFEQTKRDKEAKKNQRIVEIKEVRMSPGIDVNDFNVKDLLFDSYAHNQDVEFKILRYVENIMVSSRVYKFFRFKDKLYFKITNSDDLDILNKSNKETIENSNLSVGIILANKSV